MSYQELIDAGLVLAGSPDTVARKIAEHRQALDLAMLVGVFQLGSMPHDLVVKSLTAFAERVMPQVRDAANAA